MKKRNLLYIGIMIICIIAIIIGVYYQMFEGKVVSKKKVNSIINNDNTTSGDDSDVSENEAILTEFNDLFTSRFYSQRSDTTQIKKIEGLEEQDFVYSYEMEDKKEGEYELNIKIPVINIAGDVANKFNNTTQSIFANKTNSILSGTDKYTIYSVQYVAYLNDEILSVVIKSTLKEGNNPQRIIIQTYNYNVQTKKEVTLNEVLEKYSIDTNTVNKKIDKQVKQAKKEADAITEATGEIMYDRDLNSAIYLTDNASNFLVGKNGQIYIIYAYGNSKMTSETDIIKV